MTMAIHISKSLIHLFPDLPKDVGTDEIQTYVRCFSKGNYHRKLKHTLKKNKEVIDLGSEME